MEGSSSFRSPEVVGVLLNLICREQGHFSPFLLPLSTDVKPTAEALFALHSARVDTICQACLWRRLSGFRLQKIGSYTHVVGRLCRDSFSQGRKVPPGQNRQLLR